MTRDFRSQPGTKLLPCPFCGSQAQHVFEEDIWHLVRCENCKCATQSGIFPTKPMAIRAWHTRAAPVPQRDAEPVAWRTVSVSKFVHGLLSDNPELVALWRDTPGITVEPLYAAPARCDAGSVEASVSKESAWEAKIVADDLIGIQEDLTEDSQRDTLGMAVHYLRRFAALATPPALPAGEVRGYAACRENLKEAWAALAMIRETVETLGPVGAMKASEHLDGPTFMHEADEIVKGIRALSPSSNGKPATENEG